MRKSTAIRFIVTALVLASAAVVVLAAVSKADAQKEVTAAGKSLSHFVADPDMGWFRDNAKHAKGILICSQVVKAGFIIGGSGGRCVLAAKGDKGWNGPAFYTLASASAGFQAGVQSSEIAGLVMTQKALDSLMSNSFKFGGDASIAVGPVGAGAAGDITADFVMYSRSKGLYGGLDVTGAVVKPTEDYNNAYYGTEASPIDIIVRGKFHNPSANAALLEKIKHLWAAAAHH
jgi:lipid-binding SYLF domain-containing protein